MPGSKQIEKPPEDRVTMRSVGQQARSRERIEQLLNAAETMVAESGLEGLKMRELGRRAGLPIASVYHYFPSSNSVIRALAVRHLETLQQFLADQLQDKTAGDKSDAERARTAGHLVRAVAAFLLSNKATAVIWDMLRASPELRALDMEDTARVAKMLEPFMGWAVPGVAKDRLPMLTMLILEAIQSNLLIIMRSADDSREQTVDALADLIEATFVGLQLTQRPTSPLVGEDRKSAS